MMKLKSVVLTLLSVALLCVCMLPVSVTAASENLASNGGFERGDASGWDVKVGYVTDTDAYEGKYSLSLTAEIQWQEAALKTIPVRKNAEITVSFYYRHLDGYGNYNVFTYQGADTTVGNYSDASAWMPTSSSWRQVSYTFNSGAFDHITLKFCPNDNVDDVICAIDNLVVTMEGGDIPVNVAPYLTSFGTKNNRPKNTASNRIQNGGFESAAGAQWNTSSFIKGNLSVVEDTTAPEGNHSLYLSGDSSGFHTFSVSVEPGIHYTFSAWVKSPRLSGDNRATATFGVMGDQSHFLVYEPYRGNGHGAALLSNERMQLMATSPDDEWHLRSVTFYSGSYTTVYIGVYGADSQLYLDDIALYKSANGVEYISPLRTEQITGIHHDGGQYCADEDSLIEGIYMTTNDQKLYWSDNPAWRNGFLSFVDSGDEHGTVLKYSESAHPEWKLNYIKWIAVKPHTDYTFTMDVKTLECGDGSVTLLDDNVNSPSVIAAHNIDWGNGEWETYSITFNTGAYSRIGVAIEDGGGVALIDEVRLFENADAIADEPMEDDYIACKPTGIGTSAMELSAVQQCVLNNNFENSVHRWDIYQGTTVTAAAAHDSGYGAHLKGGGDWGALIEQRNIPVTDGEMYTFSFWYKANQNGTNMTLFGGDTNHAYVSAWLAAGQWTQFTTTIKVEGDTTLRLNFCGGGNGVAEDVFLDEVTLLPANPANLGVAFLFEQEGFHIYTDSSRCVDLSLATVIPYDDGNAYPLLQMGAVITNSSAVGTSSQAMIRENSNGLNVADVPVVYLWNAAADGCEYAVRLVEIPQSHRDTVVYARPYYVFLKDGEEIVIYGDIQSRSYNG